MKSYFKWISHIASLHHSKYQRLSLPLALAVFSLPVSLFLFFFLLLFNQIWRVVGGLYCSERPKRKREKMNSACCLCSKQHLFSLWLFLASFKMALSPKWWNWPKIPFHEANPQFHSFDAKQSFFFPPFNLNVFKDLTHRQYSTVVKTPDAGATLKSQLYHLSQVT